MRSHCAQSSRRRALPHAFEEGAHRLAGVPPVGQVEGLVDGAGRAAERRVGSGVARGADRRRALAAWRSWPARRRCPSRRPCPTCIRSPHACATPRSGVPGTWRAPASPRSCQKSSAIFIRPAAAIGLPTPSSPPLGQHRQVAVARGDAGRRRLGRLALVEQLQPLQVVELLVVERVVGLGDVDLLARLGDAGHVVGHASGVLHVLGVGEVAIGPVGGVEVPSHALDPHRGVGELGRRLPRSPSRARPRRR